MNRRTWRRMVALLWIVAVASIFLATFYVSTFVDLISGGGRTP